MTHGGERSTTVQRAAWWIGAVAALAVAVTAWPFPAPVGVALTGALVGGRIALISLGIALVYRANRVINFAAGDLGQVPATLMVLLVLSVGWNYYLALAVGLVSAVLLGALVEILLVRRFFHSPRLILTVATIGISQLLTAGALFLPGLIGDRVLSPTLNPPFTMRFEVGGVYFNANDAMAMVLIPIAIVALAVFLQRSSLGIAVRAAAERADRASMLGIPVKRLHTVVWMIASVLAFLAMFLRAGAVGLPVGQVLGPSFLVQALAAAVIGRMERFPTIAAAAIGIGILDQAMTFQPGNNPAFNDVMLFVVVLVGLLLTQRARTGRRVGADETSTWQAAREIRPVPREMVHLPEVRVGRWVIGALVVGFLVSVPWWLPQSKINLAEIVVIFGIVGLSMVVLTGWAGQVSLGQMAFVATGAAVGGALTSRAGWDMSLALLAGGAAGAVIAVVIGWPAIRRGGLTLAVITLAFALATYSYALNREFFGGLLPDQRIDRASMFGVIDVTSETHYYYLCLAALALMFVVVRGLRRSRTGRVLIGIRENERAARAYGVNSTRTTLAAFAISGFMAAFAGVLYVHQQSGLSATQFMPAQSLQVFSMVVIGGLGSIPGAVLGAFYVQGADYFLPVQWQFLATGVGLLAVLLVMPGGLGAALADARDGVLRRIARRRDLLVPSLVADRRVEIAPPSPSAGLSTLGPTPPTPAADRPRRPATEVPG